MPFEPSPLLLLAAHVLSCLLAGLASTFLMPAQYRSSPRRTFAHHALLAFFIPFLGGLALIVMALYVRVINRPFREHPYSVVRLPVFTAPAAENTLSYGAGSIRSRLINPDLPGDTRLKALLAIQNIPGNLSTRLLQEVLSDPSDDLRLTAYGMLDKGEKRINLQIHSALGALDSDPTDEQRGLICKQLASLYWELVYQGYAQHGELQDFSLRAAQRHAEDALALRPTDGELWVLSGRIALARHNPQAAAVAFNRANELGVPHGRVLSYLAELAFQSRDFNAVRDLVGAFEKQETNFSTAPLLAFWNRGIQA